jgi:hypothetical protein
MWKLVIEFFSPKTQNRSLAGAQLSRAQKKLQNGFFKIVIGPLGSEL